VICQQRLDTNSMIYVTYIECIYKEEMLGVSCGPYYIKLRFVHWSYQYFEQIMRDNLENCKDFF
jgi:hypothetical protein